MLAKKIFRLWVGRSGSEVRRVQGAAARIQQTRYRVGAS